MIVWEACSCLNYALTFLDFPFLVSLLFATLCESCLRRERVLAAALRRFATGSHSRYRTMRRSSNIFQQRKFVLPCRRALSTAWHVCAALRGQKEPFVVAANDVAEEWRPAGESYELEDLIASQRYQPYSTTSFNPAVKRSETGLAH